MILPEGLLFRASGFFSGWSCEKIGGRPNRIFSLNTSDSENRRYYCRDNGDLIIGESFQHFEMSDIELLSSWETNPVQVRDVCQFLKAGISELENSRKILFHCEAGRDRTGAVVALMTSLFLEKKGSLTDEQISAIECDYEKSESLKPYKYGRISHFLHELRDRGGVQKFLANKCQW